MPEPHAFAQDPAQVPAQVPAPVPQPARRRTHRIAVVLGVVTLGVVLAAIACLRWPLPAGFAEAWLSDRIGRTVRIEGDASFCLCPRPSLRVAQLEIGPPDWSDAERFVVARDVDLVLGAGLLVGRPIRVVSLAVGSGDVLLERTAAGRASWHLRPRGSETDAPATPPAIGRLEARDLRFRILDEARRIDLRGSLSLVDDADRPVGAGSEPGNVPGNVPGSEPGSEPGSKSGSGPGSEPGREPGSADRSARLTAQARGTMRGLPTTVSIEGGERLTGGPADRRAVRLRARVGDGRLAFEGHADALASLSGLEGRVRVRGPALAAVGALFGAVLPRTPPFRLEGVLKHAEARWELDLERGRVGGSDLRGQVVFRPGSTDRPARLDGRLRSDRMRIADLGRSVGFGEQRGRRDRMLPDVSLDLPRLRDMDAELELGIAKLELGSVAPITDLAARLRLERGVLALGRIEAGVAGGRLGGDLRIDATERPGRLDGSLRIRQVALQRWLPPLRGQPPLSSRLNADLTLTGRGESVAAVLGRADGRLRVALGPGEASRLMLEVAGLDIAETLFALAAGDRRVRLDCGLADIAIARGVATPKVMIVDTHDTVLSAEGTADLRAERLALRVRAAPRDVSPLTVRSPIDIGGTFADPTVAVDRSRIVGTVLASVVLGALVAPVAAVLPLLDFGEGDPPSPCTDRYAAAAGRSDRSPARPPRTEHGQPE